VRVVLPSEEVLLVPEGVGTVPDLKSHIEKETGIPGAAQRLFTGRGELHNAQPLAALPGNVDIDLVIAAGPSYCICRTGLRDSLDSISGEIFVTHASRLGTRDEANLTDGPPANLASASNEPTPQREESQPFLEAFAKNRSARLGQLRRTRAQLGDGPVVVSTFNWGFRDMVANWVASCDRNEIDCRAFALIFPTDERADAFAKKLGLRTYFDGESYGEQPMEGSKVFGDRRFSRMMFPKIAMTVDMLDVGGDIIRQDVDLVWHWDPRADLVRRAKQDGLDMLFMFDGPNRVHQPLHYNSGFVFIRANPFTRHAWQTVLHNYGWVLAEGGEQRLINVVMSVLQARGLSAERLPEEIYVNGHVISRVMRSGDSLPEGSALVHASWTSNLQKKVEHMKKFGLWYL
jgi:hypothetical protein